LANLGLPIQIELSQDVIRIQKNRLMDKGNLKIEVKANGKISTHKVTLALILRSFYNKSSFTEWFIEIRAENGQYYYLMNLPFDADIINNIENQYYFQDSEDYLSLNTIFINGRGNVIFKKLDFHFYTWFDNEQIIDFEMNGETEFTSINLRCKLKFNGYIFYDYNVEEILRLKDILKIPANYSKIISETVGNDPCYRLTTEFGY